MVLILTTWEKRHSAEPLGLPGSATCPHPAGDPIRPRSSLAHRKSKRPTRLLNPRPAARGLGERHTSLFKKRPLSICQTRFAELPCPTRSVLQLPNRSAPYADSLRSFATQSRLAVPIANPGDRTVVHLHHRRAHHQPDRSCFQSTVGPNHYLTPRRLRFPLAREGVSSLPNDHWPTS